MKIILARHGKTNENVLGKISGNSNRAQLVDEGKVHAQNVKEIYKNETIDAIFSSPLDRAIHTIFPLAKEKNIEIFKTGALREFDFGVLDSEDGSKAEQYLIKRRNDINFRFPGGESYADVIKRVSIFLNELNEKEYSKVFLQGHAGVNRTILAHLLGLPGEKIDYIDAANSIIYEIDTITKECAWIDSFSRKKGIGLQFRTSF